MAKDQFPDKFETLFGETVNCINTILCNKNDNYKDNVKDLQLLLKSYQNRPVWKSGDEQRLIAELIELQNRLSDARSNINGEFVEELQESEIVDYDAKMDKGNQKLVDLITGLIELMDMRINQIRSK